MKKSIIVYPIKDEKEFLTIQTILFKLGYSWLQMESYGVPWKVDYKPYENDDFISYYNKQLSKGVMNNLIKARDYDKTYTIKQLRQRLYNQNTKQKKINKEIKTVEEERKLEREAEKKEFDSRSDVYKELYENADCGGDISVSEVERILKNNKLLY